MKKIILIFLITIFTNYSFAKDLSGNAIDCYAKNNHKNNKYNIKYHATIKFLTETKVKFALAQFYDEKSEPTTNNVIPKKAEFRILLPESTFTYEVRDLAIGINVTKNVKNLYDPNEWWKRLIDKKAGEMIIWRETLDIFDPVITIRAKWEGNRMKCKLVDFHDASLFNKYNEFHKIIKNSSRKLIIESGSKNIL